MSMAPSTEPFSLPPAPVADEMILSEEERQNRVRALLEVVSTDNVAAAVYELEKSNWDVELAVSSYMDSNANFSDNDVETSGLLSSTATSSGPRRRRGSGTASRENSRAATNQQQIPSVGRNQQEDNLAMLSLSNIVGKVSGYVVKILTDPIRRITGINGDVSLEEAARQFQVGFEESYGTVHPSFICSSYKEAITQAHSREKLLLLYIHSANHPNTEEFCKETLCEESFCTYVNREMLTWGGSVEFADAYRLCDMMMVSTFPTLAVLQPSVASSSSQSSSGAQKITARLLVRIDGSADKASIMEKLRICCQQHQAVVSEARARRLQEEERRNLLEQQNREYLESQRRDREREEEKRRLEEEARIKVEALKRKRDELPEEPAADTPRGECSNIKFNLPNGNNLRRRFKATDLLQHVRDFVEVSLDDMEDNTIENFELVMNFPKKRFSRDDDHSLTIKEAGLVPQAVLFVQDLDS